MIYTSPEAAYVACMALAFVLSEFALPEGRPVLRRHLAWASAVPFLTVALIAPSPARLVASALAWAAVTSLRAAEQAAAAGEETAALSGEAAALSRKAGRSRALGRYVGGAAKAGAVIIAGGLAAAAGPAFPNPYLGAPLGYLAEAVTWTTVYLFMITGGTALVRWVLDDMVPALGEEEAGRAEAAAAADTAEAREAAADTGTVGSDSLRMGRIIGNLERLIIITLVTQGQYAAIGVVMAAKSIVRYERASGSRAFADYYLIGTLTSMAVALAGGLLLVALGSA